MVLGPDGVTWQTIRSDTAPTSPKPGIVFGSSQGSTTPSARATIAGTCTNVFASLT